MGFNSGFKGLTYIISVIRNRLIL